jgi:Domain of unknown function (DUF6542)
MTQARATHPKAGEPSRPPSSRSITLTGRGAAVMLFAACFLGLLAATRTGWSALGDVIFVTACAVVACYTRVSGLRGLVVCPPLAFFAGIVLAQALTAADTFSALTGILVTLGDSAPWLFLGTALTAAIAFGRGWRPRIGVLTDLRAALREIRPRGDRWTRRP